MKASKQFYSTDFFTLSIEEDWICATWFGFQLKESVPTGCKEILEALKKYHLFKVLNDSSRSKGLWNTDWVAEEWFPCLLQEGLKKFAWVVSPDLLCKGETEKVVLSAPASSVIMMFEDTNEAKRWLKDKQ